MQRLVAFLLCATALVGVPSQGASAGPRLNNGWLYRFHYNVELGLNRPRASARGTAGFQISSDVDISLTWRNPENQDEQLLRVQISNVQLQSAVQRSGKNNIFHGSTTESILGREKLEALQRPFMLLWKMGKKVPTGQETGRVLQPWSVVKCESSMTELTIYRNFLKSTHTHSHSRRLTHTQTHAPTDRQAG
ncbi:microsomal triglyceride transfer protein-like isoform X1 [Electrophorus electricus]|uniref:microsomal triglyceride transfer protein-like isoform X1 n=1 Tax=Electrophorus electricus TaxID=8005 RepID=UPI0015D063C1|nr:microsomal triglyceride transfer protein-like isoform X1 [Electrophorus electricus]